MKKHFNNFKLVQFILILAILFITSFQYPMEKNLPDLSIEKISVTKDCKLAITIVNSGPGHLPTLSYAQSEGKGLGIHINVDNKKWWRLELWQFDKTKKLILPGNKAVCEIDFVVKEPVMVYVDIDFWNVITENNENNNYLSEQVSCDMNKDLLSLKLSDTPSGNTTTISGQNKANFIPIQPVEPTIETLPDLPKPPQRFYIDFDDACLVYKKSFKSIQIMVASSMVSSGSDWEKCEREPGKIQLRHERWQGFSWEINITKKEIYKISNDFFCTPDTHSEKLPLEIEETGDLIYIRFPVASMVYVPESQSLEMSYNKTLLFTGENWEKCKLSNSVYHLKEEFWSIHHWKVDVQRKTISRIKGKPFDKPCLNGEILPAKVRVIH